MKSNESGLVKPPTASFGAAARASRPVARDANGVALAYVAERLRAGSFNGQIVLHVNSGIIRKTEVRDVVSTESLLTGKVDTG